MADPHPGDALRRHYDDRIPAITLDEVGTGTPERVRASRGRRNALAAVAAVALLLITGSVIRATTGDSAEGVRTGSRDDPAWCVALAGPADAGRPEVVPLLPDADRPTVDDVARRLRSQPDIAAVRSYDKDAAWANAQWLFADQPEMLGLLRPEDVGGYFVVSLTDPDSWPELQDAANGWPGVRPGWSTPSGEPPPEGGWPADSVLDRVAWLAAGAPAQADDAARQAARDTAPADLDESARAIDALLDLNRPAAVPSPAQKAGAAAIVDAADDRCGLRPRLREATSSTDTTSPP